MPASSLSVLWKISHPTYTHTHTHNIHSWPSKLCAHNPYGILIFSQHFLNYSKHVPWINYHFLVNNEETLTAEADKKKKEEEK